MSKEKESIEKPTHWLIAVPHPEGTYKDEDGQQVNIHKIPIDRTVRTKWPKFKGTTIKDFISNSKYKKA